MEQERRQDIRHQHRQRQSYNDLLMQLSGQPVREREWESQANQDLRLNNCSQNTDSLSVPRDCPAIKDVTSQTDFRGLYHADNEHALEALFPGRGHELSIEFRQRATASSQAGWPAPPAAQTPRNKGSRGNSEKNLQKEACLTREKIPVSKTRLDMTAARHDDETLKAYSKEQFLSRTAPPPPDQKVQLLHEDFSPKTTLNDPGRVTGNFQRTQQFTLDHGPWKPGSSPKHKTGKGMENLPPPKKPLTYPVLALSSPTAKGAQAQGSLQASEVGSPARSSPTFQSSVSSKLRQSNSGFPSKRHSLGLVEAPSAAVCRELDQFEASMTSLPRVSNFFGTPRSQARAAAQTQGAAGARSLQIPANGLSRSASAPAAQTSSPDSP
jgi:hypothetical protein